MQELLLLTGNVEKPQDDNNVKFVTSTVTYATLDYDPVLFVTSTVTYATLDYDPVLFVTATITYAVQEE